MNRIARWIALALAMGLGVLGALLQWESPALEGPVITINVADFIKSEEPAPPTDVPWLRRTLPDDWRRTNPGLDGYGWYRASFVLPAAPADPWAAYLPSVGTTYQLYLNGIDIGSGGGMTGAVHRNVGVPQLDPIAPQILQQGENVLLLRLRVAPNLRGGLGPITVGPRSVVEPRYDRDYLARVTLTRSLNMALIFVGLLVLLLWLRRPEERIYGWFAALSIFWSIRNFHYTVSLQAVPSNVWEAFVLGSLAIVVTLLWRFLLRFTGRSFPGAERWATVFCLVSIPVLALLDPHLVSALRIGWYLFCIGMGGWSIVVLVEFLWTPAGKEASGAWVILGAQLVTLLLGLTDFAVSAQLLPFGPAARLAYGAPILLCALVYALAENYFRTFDQVRSLNVDLERRVEQRTEELQRTHERMRALERVATVASERDRLMRDMHDGVGSQLITTLDAVERGDTDATGVALLLRECIDDLRLVIDSLEPDEHSLQIALANLRYRIEPRLKSAGIALEWQMDQGPALRSPGEVLQVLRIVQEAVTNVLKHSGASRLKVALSVRDDGMLLEVRDNGGGAGAPGDEPSSARRGLGNMRLRALQLGGRMEIESTPAGMAVLLSFPLPQAAAAVANTPKEG